MCIASIRTPFERSGKRSNKLSVTDPFNPRKFVLLLMVMTMTTMMMMMIRSPQVVHGILLSHAHIHYNAFVMEK
jgi:hypothetical protein